MVLDRKLRTIQSRTSMYASVDDGDDDEETNRNVVISPNSKRETCLTCKRIPRLCVCKVCKEKLYETSTSGDKLHTNTFVTILQDSFEHRRKLGSAIIAEQCLQNCDIVWHHCDGENATQVPRIQAQSNQYKLAVLYPSTDAIPLSEVKEHHKNLHLIVLDSTWYKAKKMYGRIPWIRDLQTVKLSENVIGRKPSGYKFRKQPDVNSLSTAECIGEAISEIEGNDQVNDVIRSAFERSVELQIEEAESREARPHYHGRGRNRKGAIKARYKDEPQHSQSNHVKIKVSVSEASIPALDWALGNTRRISEDLDVESKVYTVIISAPRDEADDLTQIIESGIRGEANRRGSTSCENDLFRIDRVPGRKLGGGRRSYEI